MKERRWKSLSLLCCWQSALHHPICIHISQKISYYRSGFISLCSRNISPTPFYAMIHNFHHPFQVAETVVLTLVSLHLAFLCEDRKIKKVSPWSVPCCCSSLSSNTTTATWPSLTPPSGEPPLTSGISFMPRVLPIWNDLAHLFVSAAPLGQCRLPGSWDFLYLLYHSVLRALGNRWCKEFAEIIFIDWLNSFYGWRDCMYQMNLSNFLL